VNLQGQGIENSKEQTFLINVMHARCHSHIAAHHQMGVVNRFGTVWNPHKRNNANVWKR